MTHLRVAFYALVVGLLLFEPVSSLAQSARLEFEVASIRATPPSMEHGMALAVRMDPSQVRIASLPLRDIIAMAYRVKPYQVIGPDWIGTTSFDVNAKLTAGATTKQIPEMLQALLAARLGLAFHREAREFPVYAMVTGNSPFRLIERASEHSAEPDAVDETLAGNPSGVSANLGHGSSYTFVDGGFQGINMTSASIAAELERFSDRPIHDLTGLKGAYDMNFTVNHDDYMALLMRAALNSGMAMPPQMALQIESTTNPLPDAVAQLGLKLDARRMPVDVLVVDAVRKTPTEN